MSEVPLYVAETLELYSEPLEIPPNATRRYLTRRPRPYWPWLALGQTLRPTLDPLQSPASFRIAVKDLEDPAVQCRWRAVSGLKPFK